MNLSKAYALLIKKTGMLGKSKGQILRVAAVLEVLFQMVSETIAEADTDETETSTRTSTCITDSAVLGAINFVDLCCQQASYMAGRGDIREDIQNVKASMSLYHNKYQIGNCYIRNY